VDLYPSEEQQGLAQAAQAVLHQHAPADGDTAASRALWTIGAEQGWLSLGLPEAEGGLGALLADEVQVFAEIGAAVAPGPFLATNLAARIAAAAGQRDLAQRLASGTARTAQAFVATADPGIVVAFDVPESEVLLLIDEEQQHLRLLGLTASAVVEELTPLDPTVPAARVRLNPDDVLAELTGEAAASVLQRGAVLVAAMLAGIARTATSMSAEYAKLRQQFGKPIGSFQAISHRCADMAIRTDAATAVVNLAAVSVDEGRDDAGLRVAAARRFAESAAIDNSMANIQNHGAIGFTWEHGAHRLLKRARLLAQGFQPRRAQTEALLGTS
jgi:alkylation response protein AidB-like acyl-CoA dehydrogenase